MRLNFTLLIVLMTMALMAQTTADFENFQLNPESFLNGSDGSGGFESGNIRLLNNYNTDYQSWTGWSISNTTDITTPGFTNQYSSITGAGQDGSSTYATAFVVGESLLHTTLQEGTTVEGFYMNNTTYSYLSMLEGDAFAKRFGGEDGTDPDFLSVTIKEYGDRNVSNDSIVVYLADYRFDDSSSDYLIDNWVYVDLSRFENVDTLSFTMQSSDIGAFGINTPTYFCIDNFVTTDTGLLSTESFTQSASLPYPNPAQSTLTIHGPLDTYVITDTNGHKVQAGQLTQNEVHTISIEALQTGIYYLSTTGLDGYINAHKFIKM